MLTASFLFPEENRLSLCGNSTMTSPDAGELQDDAILPQDPTLPSLIAFRLITRVIYQYSQTLEVQYLFLKKTACMLKELQKWTNRYMQEL